MSHQIIINEAIKSYKSTIVEALEVAESFTLHELNTVRFNTADLTEDWIKETAKSIRTGGRSEDAGKCTIYVFTLVEPVDSKAIFNAIGANKRERDEGEKKKNLCTINTEFTDSTTLYIGRSFKPRERIKQHLNSSDSGTYALHLLQWAEHLSLDLELKIYDVPQYRDEVPLERAMNIVETGLWDYLRPLLGRRGDK